MNGSLSLPSQIFVLATPLVPLHFLRTAVVVAKFHGYVTWALLVVPWSNNRRTILEINSKLSLQNISPACCSAQRLTFAAISFGIRSSLPLLSALSTFCAGSQFTDAPRAFHSAASPSRSFDIRKTN